MIIISPYCKLQSFCTLNMYWFAFKAKSCMGFCTVDYQCKWSTIWSTKVTKTWFLLFMTFSNDVKGGDGGEEKLKEESYSWSTEKTNSRIWWYWELRKRQAEAYRIYPQKHQQVTTWSVEFLILDLSYPVYGLSIRIHSLSGQLNALRSPSDRAKWISTWSDFAKSLSCVLHCNKCSFNGLCYYLHYGVKTALKSIRLSRQPVQRLNIPSWASWMCCHILNQWTLIKMALLASWVNLQLPSWIDELFCSSTDNQHLTGQSVT